MTLAFMTNVFMIRVNPSPKEKRNTMNTNTESLWSRVTRTIRDFFNRATAGTSDELETYLSTATSLTQLEDMQRRWDQAHRGHNSSGAY